MRRESILAEVDKLASISLTLATPASKASNARTLPVISL